MYFYFQNLLFLIQDNKLKLSCFVLFLECLHERFKNDYIYISWILREKLDQIFSPQNKKGL